jgi:methylglyoxal synthase
MQVRKRIGLVAHDARKHDLIDWVRRHAEVLARQELFCTGTTGRMVGEVFDELLPGRDVSLTRFHSGPLGGDQQMGAVIAEGKLDILIFLTDPMTTQPHDVDVKALVRLCSVYNIVLACTRATADFIIASPLFHEAYHPQKPEYVTYVNRTIGS